MTEEAAVVRKQIVVPAPIEQAFALFVQRFGDFKPPEHNLLAAPIAETVFEPRVGGHIFDRGEDGSECRWARVLAYEPPERVVFSWDIGPTWQIETDPENTSEVEVRFVAETPGRTRLELEHRHIDRHGPGWQAVRDGVGDDGGWPLYLARYAALLTGSPETPGSPGETGAPGETGSPGETVPGLHPIEADPPPRQTAQRKSDALELLRSQTTAWLATGSGRGGPHLVPLLFHFDGDVLTFATFLDSPTVANATADGRARAAIGHPYDLVMIDGSVTVVDPHDIDPVTADAHASLLRGGPDPRKVPGLVYLQLTPTRLQAWRSFAELGGRTLMSAGRWLV